MSGIYIVFLVVFFFLVFGLAFVLMRYLMPNPVQERLQRVGGKAELPDVGEVKPGADWVAKVIRLSSPLAKLSMPDEGWEKSSLRTRFMNAGLRNENASTIYFTIKTTLALVFPLAAWFVLAITGNALKANPLLLVLLIAASVGFYLPNIVLRQMIKSRQRQIFESIPDALDLMTICIEAGLALEAAVSRVADEMADVEPAIAEELHIVTLEMRAGNSKERALRNLAMRTGVEDVDSLVAMLVQAERFGTSVGEALRVHAEHLRTKRRQRAEEAAAKIALKLLFPLIFCIFPALMTVVIGPAIIQVVRAFSPAVNQ